MIRPTVIDSAAPACFRVEGAELRLTIDGHTFYAMKPAQAATVIEAMAQIPGECCNPCASARISDEIAISKGKSNQVTLCLTKHDISGNTRYSYKISNERAHKMAAAIRSKIADTPLGY